MQKFSLRWQGSWTMQSSAGQMSTYCHHQGTLPFSLLKSIPAGAPPSTTLKPDLPKSSAYRMLLWAFILFLPLQRSYRACQSLNIPDVVIIARKKGWANGRYPWHDASTRRVEDILCASPATSKAQSDTQQMAIIRI